MRWEQLRHALGQGRQEKLSDRGTCWRTRRSHSCISKHSQPESKGKFLVQHSQKMSSATQDLFGQIWTLNSIIKK